MSNTWSIIFQFCGVPSSDRSFVFLTFSSFSGYYTWHAVTHEGPWDLEELPCKDDEEAEAWRCVFFVEIFWEIEAVSHEMKGCFLVAWDR